MSDIADMMFNGDMDFVTGEYIGEGQGFPRTMNEKPKPRLKVGETYTIKHERKGSFVAKVMSDDGEWAELLVVSGVAKAMMQYNEVPAGETVTVRISHVRTATLSPRTKARPPHPRSHDDD